MFGIDEDAEGRATAVVPAGFNVDDEILRLSNILADGLEPRIHGIRMRAVEMSPGAAFWSFVSHGLSQVSTAAPGTGISGFASHGRRGSSMSQELPTGFVTCLVGKTG